MDSRFFNNWATQLRKGILELCIFNIISAESPYGYDIVRILRQIDSLVISEGTIYPILSRLKQEGLVQTNIRESSEGPPRKYYELTSKGEKMLEHMNVYWKITKKGSESLIKGKDL